MEKIIKKRNEGQEYKRLQLRLLLIFGILAFVSVAVIGFFVINNSIGAIKDNSSEFIAVNCSQLQINIDSYFDKVEKTAALLFSDEAYYKFDETDDSLDEYEKLQRENDILNRIVDLGIVENFSDFGIVYANNNSVGWISNTTKSLYDKEIMYSSLAANITNEKTEDGWFCGVGDDFDRLYYVKRINPNAVLVASFYSRELASVFALPKELTEMSVRLINDENQILYSSNKEEIGNSVPDDISGIVWGVSRLSYTDNHNIININPCKNGWKVLCTVPTSIITAKLNGLMYYTISMMILVIIIATTISIIVYRRIAKPMDSMMSSLEKKSMTDGLSGLLNKKSFEKMVGDELNSTVSGCGMAFIIMDVDKFKQINDNEGHSYGDQFIVKTADFIKRSLPSNAIIGRIGGDEFCFLIKDADKQRAEMESYIREILDNVLEGFTRQFEHEHQLYNVSISAGAYVNVHREESFEEVYKCADQALYKSKEGGRNRYTIYEEEQKNEN